MSRGFRDADDTLELTSRTADERLGRIHRADAEQAAHAAAIRAEGKHGVCEDCGGAIDPERLQFLPDATRCVSCQARIESQPSHA